MFQKCLTEKVFAHIFTTAEKWMGQNILVENPLFFWPKMPKKTKIFIFVDSIQFFCSEFGGCNNFVYLFLLRKVSKLFIKWKDVKKCRKNKISYVFLILDFVGLWRGLTSKIPGKMTFYTKNRENIQTLKSRHKVYFGHGHDKILFVSPKTFFNDVWRDKHEPFSHFVVKKWWNMFFSFFCSIFKNLKKIEASKKKIIFPGYLSIKTKHFLKPEVVNIFSNFYKAILVKVFFFPKKPFGWKTVTTQIDLKMVQPGVKQSCPG